MGILRSILRRRRGKQQSTASSSPTSPSAGGGTLAFAPEELERVFGKFDTNGDGKISSAELSAIFESLGHPPDEEELATMMAEADTDGDGFISLEEFIDLNTRMVDAATALEDLRHAFSVFDLDRNGSISPEELAKVLRSIGEGATVAQCRKMISGVDQDGDGLISFEEFKLMMSAGSALAAALAAGAKNE